MTIDLAIAEWMKAHQSAALDAVCAVLMFLGADLRGMALSALILAALCLALGRRDVLVTAYAAIGATMVLNRLLKLLINRPRPGPEFAQVPTEGSSMPSTAAAVTAAGVVVLVLLVAGTRWLHRFAALAGGLLIASIGYAVIYLGTHWLTDVIAGAALGAMLGVLARGVRTRINRTARVTTASQVSAHSE